MYTEDDEKTKIKEDKSHNENPDFYTSFNEIEKTSTKKKKKNKDSEKNNSVNEPKDEKDYSDFYVSDDEHVLNEETINDGNKKYNFKIILIIALAIIFLLLIFILIFAGKKVRGDIELTKTDISLNIGEKEYISYKIIDTESSVTSTFESSNTSVALVDNNGEIRALDIGEAVITIHYTIDGVTRNKKCNVKVNNNSGVNTNITLDLSGFNNNWTNSDAIINVSANSIYGISKVQYALNCDSDCNYQDVSNNKIVVSTPGTTKVRVIAKDVKNQEAIKDVVVKIDKEAPSVSLNSDKNIVSNTDVTVCATCSDSLSGCREAKVCKTYTSSKSNQVITVSDNAGNKKNSDSFNVTINKRQATLCKLKVSSDGIVTATLDGEATYYGFNSGFSGNNELSKKITINANNAGESKAQIVNYYFQNKNGVKGSCSIIVIKTCICQNNTGNCQVTCTFKSQ